MRIVCPKCELKGQVDAVPMGAKTRIACVRCATTFEAVFIDGEIQAIPSSAVAPETTIESTVSEVRADGEMTLNHAGFASAPEMSHANQFDASPRIEPSLDALETFSTSSPDLMPESIVEAAQVEPEEISDELAPQSTAARVDETANAGGDFIATARPLKSDTAGKAGRAPSDAYGMGVRLLRVSPLWLLLVGLGFISFIVLCNWLIKPTEQPADLARRVTAANNHATNQSAKRLTVAASTAQSPVNSGVGQTSGESPVAFIPTEAREATPPAAAKAEAVETKPAVAEKPAIPAATPSRADEAKAGKVTIQIGSYNAAAEAEERVANLKSAGFEARSVKVDIPQRGTWYRVQSGRFLSRGEAESYGRQLREKGVVSSFITTDVQE